MATHPHDIELPGEFSGHAQFVLYNRYGDPRECGWENKWINKWHVQERFPWFPEPFVMIHKHFQAMLESAFRELALYDLYKEIRSCVSCFELRNMKTHNSLLSLHAWGAAIDLNSVDNPKGTIAKWTPDFLRIMVNNGIYCGQHWIDRKDPMHFAMLNG